MQLDPDWHPRNCLVTNGSMAASRFTWKSGNCSVEVLCSLSLSLPNLSFVPLLEIGSIPGLCLRTADPICIENSPYRPNSSLAPVYVVRMKGPFEWITKLFLHQTGDPLQSYRSILTMILEYVSGDLTWSLRHWKRILFTTGSPEINCERSGGLKNFANGDRGLEEWYEDARKSRKSLELKALLGMAWVRSMARCSVLLTVVYMESNLVWLKTYIECSGAFRQATAQCNSKNGPDHGNKCLYYAREWR